jgi:hypothetical protein
MNVAQVVSIQELTALQKVLQIALAWIIPLIGAIIVISILTAPEYLRRRHGIVIPRGDDSGGAGHMSEKTRDGEGGGAEP